MIDYLHLFGRNLVVSKFKMGILQTVQTLLDSIVLGNVKNIIILDVAIRLKRSGESYNRYFSIGNITVKTQK